MSSAEFAGALKERVTLEYQAAGTDARGAADGAWLSRGTAWAAIVPAGEGAAYAADAVAGEPRYRVTMRRRLDLSVGDRLVWRGRILSVLSFTTDPAQLDRMTCLVEQLR